MAATTDKIVLRMFEEDDCILINKWRNDPSQIELMHAPFRYISLGIEREWVRSKMMENTREIYLAICLNDESRRMIGYTSIIDVDYLNRKALIGGIWIGEQEYRNGEYAAEALYGMVRYGFMTYNLERLSTYCLTNHPSSLSLFMSLGFNIEGCLRHSCLKDGCFHDEYLIALLHEDFMRLSQQGQYALPNICQRRSQCLSALRQGADCRDVWREIYGELL